MSRPQLSSFASLLVGSAATFLALQQLDTRGRQLAQARSEQPTGLRNGVGPVVRRKVWAQVRGAQHSAQDVTQDLMQHFPEYMPSALSWVLRRRPRSAPVREGEKFDIQLFLLRRAKVKVDDITPLSFTIRTLRQHPDAGFVKIAARPIGGPNSHDFELDIESIVRSSNVFDRAVYVSGIKWLQHFNWEIVLGRALEYAGGQIINRDALIEEYPYQDQ